MLCKWKLYSVTTGSVTSSESSQWRWPKAGSGQQLSLEVNYEGKHSLHVWPFPAVTSLPWQQDAGISCPSLPSLHPLRGLPSQKVLFGALVMYNWKAGTTTERTVVGRRKSFCFPCLRDAVYRDESCSLRSTWVWDLRTTSPGRNWTMVAYFTFSILNSFIWFSTHFLIAIIYIK